MSRANSAPLVGVLIGLVAGLVPATTSSAEDVEVVESRKVGAQNCPYIQKLTRPMTGGCVVKVDSAIRASLVSPFGDLPFGTCRIRFIARTSPEGEVVFDRIRILGDSPCGDIRACEPATAIEKQPWVGTIVVADSGDYRVRMDACLDTCAGWFEDQLELRLIRHFGGWKLAMDRATLGDTGLSLDGDLVMSGSRFDVRPEDSES